MNKPTQTQERTQQQQMPDEGRSKGQVATLQPARLPYHPVYEERYGVDGAMWRALVEGVYPSAQTPEAIILAVSYCKSRNLDIMKKPVHIVPIWNSKLKKSVESIWPGIGELRTTAARTGAYAGCDETTFGPMKQVTFKGNVGYDDNPKNVEITLTFPEWARITVYRVVAGVRCAFPGPMVSFLGAYGTVKQTEVPNDKWADDPSYMLEKCAEAAALRKAFPEELQGMNAAEEMEGRNVDTGTGPIIDHEPAPPKPTRESVKKTAEAVRKENYEMDRQFRDTMRGDEPAKNDKADDRAPPIEHDAETGEVTESEPDNSDADPHPSSHPQPSDVPQPAAQGSQAASKDEKPDYDYDAIEDRLSGLIAGVGSLTNFNKIIANNTGEIEKLKTSKEHYDRIQTKIADKKRWFSR